MKRYDLVLESHGMECWQDMQEAEDGDWVRYEDAYSWGSGKVESLIAERDDLAAQVRTLQCQLRTEMAIKEVYVKHVEKLLKVAETKNPSCGGA